MSRRILQLAAILLVTLASLTPLLELFDHWDGKVTVPANDTELRVTAAAALGGLLFATAALMRIALRRPSAPPLLSRLAPAQPARSQRIAPPSAPTASPPLIPLRI